VLSRPLQKLYPLEVRDHVENADSIESEITVEKKERDEHQDDTLKSDSDLVRFPGRVGSFPFRSRCSTRRTREGSMSPNDTRRTREDSTSPDTTRRTREGSTASNSTRRTRDGSTVPDNLVRTQDSSTSRDDTSRETSQNKSNTESERLVRDIERRNADDSTSQSEGMNVNPTSNDSKRDETNEHVSPC